MVFKTLRDIENDREERERNEFKRKVTTDIKDVFGGIFEPPKRREEKKKNKFWSFVKGLSILFFFLLIINLILGNIWLLKFFLKDFFGG